MASNFVTLDELKQKAKEAIDGLEVARCKHLLDELVDTYDTGSSPDLASLEMLLTLVAFPELEDQKAGLVVRLHLLDFYRVGLSFEDALVTRYIFSGETEKNKQREIIKEAILQNEEKIGSIGVSQWLKNFDKMESPEKRNEDAIRRFLSKEPMINQLSSQESELLRSILLIYERLIATEIISVDDVIGYHLAIDGKQSDESLIVQSSLTSKAKPSSDAGITRRGEGIKRLPLLKALSEYPRIGDQNITANRIKTKQAPEPVRGSLTNWIHYYRDELGIGFHDQVKRGQFLFQSENGKRLSGEERERLNLILKSIEEEFPLDIDTDRQLIVFPLGSPELQHQSPQTPKGATEPFQSPKGVSQSQPFVVPKGMSRPGRSTVPSQSASWAIPKPAIAFNYGRPVAASSQVNPSQVPKQVDGKSRFMEVNSKPAENIADATLRFSTGHVLPSEKAAPSVLKPQNFANPQSGTVAPAQSVGISNTPKPISGGDQRIVTPVQNTQRSPYSIHPLRPRS